MTDTLFTIHTIALNEDFRGRLTASAAQEEVPGDPGSWVWERRYQIAAAPSWAEKVDSWNASHPEGPEGGWATDQSVISDLDITATVQSLIETPKPTESNDRLDEPESVVG